MMVKTKKLKYPIWHIRWKDAVYRLDSEEDPNVPLHCEMYDAVGFIIRDDKEKRELEFVQEVCTDGTVRHRNVISYEMLEEYNVLRK
jgi:hypothetical protein